MKTVIEMAREVGFTEGELAWHDEMLERFAEIVRADERDKWMERTAILIRGEREACAKVCDAFQKRDVGMQPAECAGAIRARSNT